MRSYIYSKTPVTYCNYMLFNVCVCVVSCLFHYWMASLHWCWSCFFVTFGRKIRSLMPADVIRSAVMSPVIVLPITLQKLVST